MEKKGTLGFIWFDILGFLLIIIGSILFRYVQNEILSSIAGVGIAIGITILTITRWITK